MSDMIKMEKVSFLENFQLEVLLTDGRICSYDLRPKLKTVRFYDLDTWDAFSSGFLKRGLFICWNNGVELSIDEILLDGKTDKEILG